jgi:two-component system phosphate regulon sensor histidine kinase PhoR
MSRVWTRTALQHLAVLLGGLFIGWLYDGPLLGLLAALAVLLGWHIYHLQRLEHWVRTGENGPLPSGNGPWSQVLAQIQAVKDESRLHRKNWRRLVKELRASTKAFPDGGVLLTVDHEIVRANKAARQMLGLKKHRDRKTRIENLVRHPDFVEYLQRGSSTGSVEIPAPAESDGWLSCRLIPYGPDQQLLLVRDITATVKGARMRREFVANASHELRSPLTVLAGYLDVMAEDETLPDAWKRPVLDMRAQAGRMNRLVQDLLELSRLESGGSVPRREPVDIGALLERARRDAQVLPGPVPRIEVDAASQACLLGEETELQSVVSNLVSNAIRYTPAEGTITMAWRVDDAGGHLSVKDTGIGIAPDELPRITERFYRGDGGRARQNGGTGLGLAIVKHVLKRHDAELEVVSEVGEGSTFTCHFPRERLAAG